MRAACSELIPPRPREGLADAVDVYVEDIAFSLDDLEAIAAAAADGRARPARARGPARRLRRGGGRRAARRPQRRSPEPLLARGRRCPRRERDGRGPAAGLDVLPAGQARPGRGAARGRRADRDRDRREPRHLAGRLDAGGDRDGGRRLRGAAARGAHRRHAEPGVGARPRRPTRHARGRASAPTSCCSRTPRSRRCRTAPATIPVVATIVGGESCARVPRTSPSRTSRAGRSRLPRQRPGCLRRTRPTASAMSGPNSRSASKNGTRALIAAVHGTGRRTGLERRAQVERLRRAERLERDHGLGVRDDLSRVAGRRHAHAHVILLPGARGDRVDRGRMRERLALAHQRGGRVLHEHESRVQTRAVHEERRQPVRMVLVEQPVEATLRDRCERDERGRDRVERDRDRLTVEVPAGDDLADLGQHDGVVAHAVDLDPQHLTRVGERVAGRAVHLGGTAQRVGVLHEVGGVAMRREDRRAGEQPSQVRGARRLAGMRTQRLQPLVERADRCRARPRSSSRRRRRRCGRASRPARSR